MRRDRGDTVKRTYHLRTSGGTTLLAQQSEVSQSMASVPASSWRVESMSCSSDELHRLPLLQVQHPEDSVGSRSTLWLAPTMHTKRQTADRCQMRRYVCVCTMYHGPTIYNPPNKHTSSSLPPKEWKFPKVDYGNFHSSP